MKICSLRNENLQFAKFGFLEQLLEENYPLGHHSETHAQVVMKLFEAASCFCCTREEAILMPGLL